MATSSHRPVRSRRGTGLAGIVRRRLAGRDQSGLTLMEMIVVIGLITVLTATLTTWAMATTVANMRTQNVNRETGAFTLVNSELLRDISSAQFATSTKSKRPPVPDPANPGRLMSGGLLQPGDLADCPTVAPDGSAEGAGEPVLALVTPGDRRVVFTLVDAEPGSGDRGKVLYRRDCSNALLEVDPVTGLPDPGSPRFTGDPLTNDPTLTDEEFLGRPAGEEATRPTQVRKLADGFASIETECLGADPASIAVDECVNIQVTITPDSSRPAAKFQGTRRTDVYCPPGCVPTAAFAYEPASPYRGDTVTVDGSGSFDRRGDYLGVDPSDVTTRLTYQWEVSGTPADRTAVPVPNCDALDSTVVTSSANPATPQLISYTFMKPSVVCRYEVKLTVTNAYGSSGSTVKVIDVNGLPPLAEITAPSPSPVRIVRGTEVQFTSRIETKEASLDGSSDPFTGPESYWDFGDGAPLLPLVPSATGPGLVTPCAAAAASCTATAATAQPRHTFNQQGTFTVRLVVTDEFGLRSYGLLTVVVESEYLYVSEKFGSDTPDEGWCGTVTPVYKACKTIQQALANAATYGRSDVLVGLGEYSGFTVQPGIDVRGGRDDGSSGEDPIVASWAFESEEETIVTGTEDLTPGVYNRASIRAVGSQTETTIADLTIQPGDTTRDDQTAIGVLLRNSRRLTLDNVVVNNGLGVSPTGVLLRENSQLDIVNSVIRSGRAKSPSVTDTGTSDFQRSTYGVRVLDGSTLQVDASVITSSPGLPGRAGSNGANYDVTACSGEGSDPRTGAAGASCTGTYTGTPGGAGGGGGGGGSFFSRGKAGNWGSSGSPAGFGGRPGDGGYCVTPSPDTGRGGGGGNGGQPGDPTTAGAAGSESATRAEDLWAGPQAGTGGSGQHGGGGGGAGGSGGTYCAGGATGGQGGDGGGGGLGGNGGGTGGWAGGGSFGIYVNDGSVEVVNGTRITAGQGGRGGNGGIGGRGAHGGAGGAGSTQGKGGDGSAGGGGGGGGGASGGGGGASGPSVGVFVKNGTPGVGPDNNVVGSTGAGSGSGGAGGPGGMPGPRGAAATPQPWPAQPSRAGDPGQPGSTGRRGVDGRPGIVCGVYAPDLASGCFSSTVQSIRIPTEASNPTGSSTPQWTVTFSEPVVGVTASNFALDGTGVSFTGVSAPTPTANPRVWTVGATGVSGNGTLGLMLVNTTGITMNGQPMEDPLPMPFVDDYYEIDQVAPNVTAIVRRGPNPTNLNLVTWYVYFDELVTGVIPANFSGSPATGSITPALAPVTGATPVPGTYAWQVTRQLSGTTGDGTVGLNLGAQFNLIKDAAGNELAPDTVVGEVFAVDRTAPHVVSVKRASGPNPSNRTAVPFEVKFSEPVTDLTPADFQFIYTGSLAGGVVTQPAEGDDPATADIRSDDGITWVITPRGLTGQGSIAISPLGTIRDLANNFLVNTPPANPNEVFDIDLVKPTVVSITRLNPAGRPTNVNTVTWRVDFDETVSGVTASNFRLLKQNSPTTGTITVNAVGGHWEVTATPTGAQGELKLELNNVAGVLDQVGNPLDATFTTGQDYLIDKIAPTSCRLAGHDCATGSIGTAWSNNTNGTYNMVLRGTDNAAPGQSGVGRICYTAIADGVTEFNNVCVNEGQPGFTADTAPGQSTLSVNLPFRDPGNWTIRYRAVDRAGNIGSEVTETFQLRLDVSAPWIELTSPPNNARLSSTSVVYMTESGMETPYDGFIRGTVQERLADPWGNGGQSGLVNDAIQVSVRRMETEQYWNPTTGAFQSTEHFIPTSSFTPHWSAGTTVNWTLPFEFPTGGTYEVKAVATDLASNVDFRVHTVHIDYATAAAMFVTTGGDDSNTGLCPAKSSAAICQPNLGVENGPVRTINKALELAPGRGRREIVVRAGTYNETVIVTPANLVGGQPVIIRGGYRNLTHSAVNAWLRQAPGSSRVEIAGDPVGGTHRGTAMILNAPAQLQQLRIAPSLSPVTNGTSSYAVRASGASGVSIVNSVLAARPGAAGADGATGGAGANVTVVGGVGANGTNGSDPAGAGNGGSGGGGGAHNGGNGGRGGFNGYGSAGSSGTGPAAGGAGSGGRDERYGGCDWDNWRTSQGGTGGGGGGGGGATAGGNGGAGGSSGAVWTGNNGATGTVGGSGSGGGGGGGGGGGTSAGACSGDRGGGGAGGGAGAVGGSGGLPGSGGGGSFGIYSHNSSIDVSAPNTCGETPCISANTGGTGGNGGTGGRGGNGGNGGKGGNNGGEGASGGGGGGAGGGGAGGAGGGGGAGGPSIGIYSAGTGGVNSSLTPNFASAGSGGAAGGGGARGNNGAAGGGGDDVGGPGSGGHSGNTGSQAANGNAGVAGTLGLACRIANAVEGCGATLESLSVQGTGVALNGYVAPSTEFFVYAKITVPSGGTLPSSVRADMSSIIAGQTAVNMNLLSPSQTIGGVSGYNYRSVSRVAPAGIADGTYKVTVTGTMSNGSIYADVFAKVDRTAPIGGSISYIGGDYLVPGSSDPIVHLQLARGVDPACTPNNNCTFQLQRFEASVGATTDQYCQGAFTLSGTMTPSSMTVVDDGTTPMGPISRLRCYQYRLVETDQLGNSVTHTGPPVRITAGNHWTAGLTWATFLYPADNTYTAATWSFPRWDGSALAGFRGTADPSAGQTMANVTASVRRNSTGLYCDRDGCDHVNPVQLAEGGGNLRAWEFFFPFEDFPASGRYTVTVTGTSTDGTRITAIGSFNVTL